jgi:CheY-like chemotaxis protein
MMSQTIVWVDDDAHIIYPVVKPLEQAGYKIVIMRNLKEARQRVGEVLSATVVILDLIFPDEARDRFPGLTFMRNLRNDHNIQSPVIVLSVVGNTDVIQELNSLGVRSVLRKPVLPSELRHTVATCLGLPNPDEEISYS